MALDNEFYEIRKKINGFKTADRSVLDYDMVKKSIQLISEIKFSEKESITTKPINPKRISKDGRKYIETLFPDLDKDILFLPFKEVERIFFSLNKGNASEEEFIKTINQNAKIESLFNVPINFTVKNVRDASALLCVPTPDNSNLIPLVKSIASRIDITGPADYLTTIIYDHELIHLLLKRFKGIVEDYYLDELLPIFIEKVIAFEQDQTEDLASKMEEFRLRGHQKEIHLITHNIDTPQELGHQHLISGLLANCMFDRYYNESLLGRKNLLNEVQMVLNGYKTVSQLLKEQDFSLVSTDVVRATEKSIKRVLVKK